MRCGGRCTVVLVERSSPAAADRHQVLPLALRVRDPLPRLRPSIPCGCMRSVRVFSRSRCPPPQNRFSARSAAYRACFWWFGGGTCAQVGVRGSQSALDAFSDDSRVTRPRAAFLTRYEPLWGKYGAFLRACCAGGVREVEYSSVQNLCSKLSLFPTNRRST